jgi:hypothetical protein
VQTVFLSTKNINGTRANRIFWAVQVVSHLAQLCFLTPTFLSNKTIKIYTHTTTKGFEKIKSREIQFDEIF